MLPYAWLDTALSSLPPERDISERNAAISAVYARLFLARPDLYFWSGMAAFASFRVGLLLALYDFSYEHAERATPDDIDDLINDAHLLDSLEILRRANNDIFRSAGIAHLAYSAADGGFESVCATVNPEWNEPMLVEGFRHIDHARHHLSGGRARRAASEAWFGNKILLEHEQCVTVERHFRAATFQLGALMSLGTSLDFDANHLRRDKGSHSSFYRYMLTRGSWRLVTTMSLPSITRTKHRWAWAKNVLLPTWRRVVSRDPALQRKLQRIVRRAQPFDADDYLRGLGVPLRPGDAGSE